MQPSYYGRKLTTRSSLGSRQGTHRNSMLMATGVKEKPNPTQDPNSQDTSQA